MSNLNEFEPDLFTLEDEEGNEQTFELVDVYKEDDITYYALIPQQSDPDNLEEDDYFVILKKDDNDGDEYLSSVDDENELDRLAEILWKEFLQKKTAIVTMRIVTAVTKIYY